MGRNTTHKSQSGHLLRLDTMKELLDVIDVDVFGVVLSMEDLVQLACETERTAQVGALAHQSADGLELEWAPVAGTATDTNLACSAAGR